MVTHELTDRQRGVLRFITRHIADYRRAPTYQEIARGIRVVEGVG